MKVLKIIGYVIAAFVGLVILTVIISRFSDGPTSMLPGGQFESGQLMPTPTNWQFVHAAQVVELESGGRSRLTWVVAVDQQAYIPASVEFPPFKTWHKEALKAPAAMIRLDGKRYPVTLERIPEGNETYRKVVAAILKKYAQGVPGGKESQPPWIFRLGPGAAPQSK